MGMEEGTETDVPGPEIGLIVGEPAQFRFLGSTIRRDDVVGTMLERWNTEELEELDPLETALEAADGDPARPGAGAAALATSPRSGRSNFRARAPATQALEAGIQRAGVKRRMSDDDDPDRSMGKSNAP